MKAPLGGADVPRDDVPAATDYVSPSIEILDTRIQRSDKTTGKTRTVFDTISDNAAKAGVVLGPMRHRTDAVDLPGSARSHRATGTSRKPDWARGLNDPVESVVWLARRMPQYGQGISPGQIILPGSFIRPVECPAGARIEADFGDFERFDISFA
ncbi:MAG: hypothetical protein Tsb0019_02900 [Roseibium sp.]